ncbi:MAG TPA: DUF6505 family protein [Burkholderiales bacterium]
MKFLRAVRLPATDGQLVQAHGLLEEGAWVVSGGFAICDLAAGIHHHPACRCDVSFIGLASRRRCTVAEVVEIDDQVYRDHVAVLARHLLEEWGAPSAEAARAAAEDEVAYTVDLCECFSPEAWITVQRRIEGGDIKEHYSVFKRLLVGELKL